MKLINCHHIKKCSCGGLFGRQRLKCAPTGQNPPDDDDDDEEEEYDGDGDYGHSQQQLWRRRQRRKWCLQSGAGKLQVSLAADTTNRLQLNDSPPSAGSIIANKRRRRTRRSSGANQWRPFSVGQLLSLSLMCLIIVSDFQQQIANQYAQSIVNQRGEEVLLANKCEGPQEAKVLNHRQQQQQHQQQQQMQLLPGKSDKITTTTNTNNSRSRLDISKQANGANHLAAARPTTSAWTWSWSWRPRAIILLAEANPDANRLYEDLMMTYNRIVRPVQNNSDQVVVKLSLKLSQLIDVNLKNQMMTTNVWLNQEWFDYKLKWDPSEYGGIEDINVPAEQIWLPDIVLYNSAEGYFAVSIMTKAKVHYDGHVTWNPPAIFRSSCQIDITYFPFDSQNCRMKFGSWTFGALIDLRHINDTEQSIERGTDLSEYYQNVEWDIMEASARRNNITYICCPNDFYIDVTFNFTLRRKPLFYTVNLILPCIGITILSFLVFYLPSDSGEKVTLTISILVSLIFFLSVLIETIPSTSLAMPLLGKYLVFTMILITVSVCATVCVLNIHFRTPSTHSMSPWIKRWCIDILPRYLFMNVPQCQQANTLLPEQLIYQHNQAYASQPPLVATNWTSVTTAVTSSASKAPQQQPSSMAPPLAKLNHQNAEWSPSTVVATTTNNNNNKINAATTLSRGGRQHSFRQLDPNSLEPDTSKQLNSSPSSLFLPYLQSEAARRLKMQRSRSSDREMRSTASDNNPPINNTGTKVNTNVLNNHCDSQATNKQREQTSTKIDMCDQVPGSDKKQQQTRKKKNEQQQVGAKSTNKSSSVWRLFGGGRKSASKKQTGESENGERQRSCSDHHSGSEQSPIEGETTTLAGRAANLQHDTSSSFENDYQHHNHFQARASICSTNLWRIGPTRRCSMAVPTNYPTYYRPLVQLAHQQQHSSGQAGQISTLSGYVGPGHYHTHLTEDSASSNSQPSELISKGAIGALISATASNMPIRQVPVQVTNERGSSGDQRQADAASSGQIHGLLHNNGVCGGDVGGEGQEMKQLNSGLIRATTIQPPYATSPQSIVGYAVGRQQASSHVNMALPTPPPPLPPKVNDQVGGQRMTMSHSGLHQQRIILPDHEVVVQRQHLQMAPQSSGVILNPASLLTNGQEHPSRQVNNDNIGRQTVQIGAISGSGNRLSATTFQQPLPMPPINHYMQQPSGQVSSSNNQSGYHHHVNLNGGIVYGGGGDGGNLTHTNSNHQTNASPIPYTLSGPSDLPVQYQHQNQQQQSAAIGQVVAGHQLFMPRSRSSDHRLCMYARNMPGFYIHHPQSSNQELPVQIAGGSHSPRPPPPSTAVNNLELSYEQQQHQHSLKAPLLNARSLGGNVNVSVAGMQQQQQPIGNSDNSSGNYLLQNSRNIGRALGQAYMQRLQRQPTIYSLHQPSHHQRPSRSIHRNATAAAYILPLDNQHLRCQNSLDKIRRSRSQTLFDRRGFVGTDCEQCNSLRRAESRLQFGGTSESSAVDYNHHHHAIAGCYCDQMNKRLNSMGCGTGGGTGSGGGSLRCRSLTMQNQCCNNTSRRIYDPIQQHCTFGNSSRIGIGDSLDTDKEIISGCHAMSSILIPATAANHHHHHKHHHNHHHHHNQHLERQQQHQHPTTPSLGLMKLISEVDKAIQNAMFIAQHIDNLDEFESVKENWKYIAMVIDRIFLIAFLFACIVGTVTIFGMVPWSNYTIDKPIDLHLTRLMALNLTASEPYRESCREF